MWIIMFEAAIKATLDRIFKSASAKKWWPAYFAGAVIVSAIVFYILSSHEMMRIIHVELASGLNPGAGVRLRNTVGDWALTNKYGEIENPPAHWRDGTMIWAVLPDGRTTRAVVKDNVITLPIS